MEIFNVKEITTADGYKISCRIFQSADNVIGAVLIVSGMGIAQNYYHSFLNIISRAKVSH